MGIADLYWPAFDPSNTSVIYVDFSLSLRSVTDAKKRLGHHLRAGVWLAFVKKDQSFSCQFLDCAEEWCETFLGIQINILGLSRQYLIRGLWLLFICFPGAFAFIVLKEQTACVDRIKEELKTLVASKIAKYAVPDHILVSGRLKLVLATGNGHNKQPSPSCLQCCCCPAG